MGRDALAHLEVLGLCEECRNDCKMKAPKGSKLKCPNYKKLPLLRRKNNMASLGEQRAKLKKKG